MTFGHCQTAYAAGKLLCLSEQHVSRLQGGRLGYLGLTIFKAILRLKLRSFCFFQIQHYYTLGFPVSFKALFQLLSIQRNFTQEHPLVFLSQLLNSDSVNTRQRFSTMKFFTANGLKGSRALIRSATEVIQIMANFRSE